MNAFKWLAILIMLVGGCYLVLFNLDVQPVARIGGDGNGHVKWIWGLVFVTLPLCLLTIPILLKKE